ncbi:hypothetical protein ACINWC487_0989 [Acinetobacter nosocomialis]|nr:hypothetical protein ACINWC487_0989 [Acinetobacter nosocomialis]
MYAKFIFQFSFHCFALEWQIRLNWLRQLGFFCACGLCGFGAISNSNGSGVFLVSSVTVVRSIGIWRQLSISSTSKIMSMAAIRISSDEPLSFLERAIRSNLIFISSVHLKVTLAVNFSAIAFTQEKTSGRRSDSEIFPSLSLFIVFESVAETLPP